MLLTGFSLKQEKASSMADASKSWPEGGSQCDKVRAELPTEGNRLHGNGRAIQSGITAHTRACIAALKQRSLSCSLSYTSKSLSLKIQALCNCL